MIISRNSPIALIDSGIGGLSMLKKLNEKYPKESYIYLADNEYMPYGNKSATFLKSRLLQLVNYLYDNFNIKLVILACNTASVSALNYLNKHSPVHVLGLNLEELIKVGDYQILCTKLSAKNYKNLNVYCCGKLANVIEENIFDKSTLNRKIINVMNKANIVENNIILGCTHYELAVKEFRSLYPNKNFILPCDEFVKKLKLDKTTSNLSGNILMLSTMPTKSYIDKLWKIFS